jgi:hypothetical protein
MLAHAAPSPAARGHGSLLQARILKFIEAGITAEAEIDARCRHAPLGMRFPTPTVMKAISVLVKKEVLEVEIAGSVRSYRLACVQDVASAIPERARGTYVPPIAPPRQNKALQSASASHLASSL